MKKIGHHVNNTFAAHYGMDVCRGCGLDNNLCHCGGEHVMPKPPTNQGKRKLWKKVVTDGVNFKSTSEYDTLEQAMKALKLDFERYELTGVTLTRIKEER